MAFYSYPSNTATKISRVVEPSFCRIAGLFWITSLIIAASESTILNLLLSFSTMYKMSSNIFFVYNCPHTKYKFLSNWKGSDTIKKLFLSCILEGKETLFSVKPGSIFIVEENNRESHFIGFSWFICAIKASLLTGNSGEYVISNLWGFIENPFCVVSILNLT